MHAPTQCCTTSPWFSVMWSMRVESDFSSATCLNLDIVIFMFFSLVVYQFHKRLDQTNLGKMARHFQVHCHECKVLYFYSNFTEVCSWGPNHNSALLRSWNGMAPNRRQAIAWTNAYLVHWRVYAALYIGGDELTLNLHLLMEAEWRIYSSINLPSLVQIMACRLVGAKPLSETMLAHCSFELRNKL